jgi:O-antigen/teichoic acid export membrane protein
MNSSFDPTRKTTNVGLRVEGGLLARNTALNLVGRVLPLAVAVLAMPYTVRHLGPDRFGILSLAWVVTGYFALFDLGVGSAVTKFVAEFLGKGETEKLSGLVWTALASQLCLGVLAGLLLAAATPFLVDHLLKIPLGIRSEADWVFLILAASLPVGFAAGSLGGVLAASQRFDLLNAIGIPSSALSYLLPLVGLAAGLRLPSIVLLLVLARIGSLVATYYLCVRIFPSIGRSPHFEFRLVKRLLGFGGWVTVSGAVGPVLVYFDRFLIGSLVSIAAVGFYTPPYLIASRLSILPASLTVALFPAFSTSAGRGDNEWIESAMVNSVKYLLLIVGPIALGLIFFARPALGFWLGSQFALKGSSVMQILAVGLLINALAYVPYSLLQGVGRPDLTAKFHLLELPIHVGLAWFLVSLYGLPGAAVAWTIRAAIDSALLFGACLRLRIASLRSFAEARVGKAAALLLLFAGSLLLISLWKEPDARTACGGAALAVFALGSWHVALNDRDRKALVSALRSIGATAAAVRS